MLNSPQANRTPSIKHNVVQDVKKSKIRRGRNNRSKVTWILSNRYMSFSHKICRLSQIARLFLLRLVCFLGCIEIIYYWSEDQSSFSHKLLLNIKRLESRGFRVRLVLVLQNIQLSEYNSESDQALTQLIARADRLA